MKTLLVVVLLYSLCPLGGSQGTYEKLPPAVYNPWFSYVVFKWLMATNPELAAQLLQSFPRGAPVQYHTLSGTAVHLVGGPSSRFLDFKIKYPRYRQTDNFINSQVSGQYKYDGLL